LAHDHTAAAYRASLSADADLAVAAAADGGPGAMIQPRGAPVCRLTIRLVDAATGKPLAGLVRITRPDGNFVGLDRLFNRGTGLPKHHPGWQWSLVLESAVAPVPQMPLVVSALSGLETERGTRSIDLTGKDAAELTIRMKRFSQVAKSGWRAGNTHLHLMKLTRRQADRYLQSVCRADGLEMVFVSYLRRVDAERHYISNTYTKEDLEQLSGDGVRFAHGEEHRHNFVGGEGYGHVMLLDIKELIQPVSIGSGIMGKGPDWPPVRRGIERARRDGVTTVWCHGKWGLEEVPAHVAGTLDAHNIFDSVERGTYENVLYRFLDIGLRVPFSTGTDWFIFDFARVYARIDGPVTTAKWLAALAGGRTFITNGPLLTLRIDQHRVGDTIRLAEPGQFKVRGHAIGRQDFQKLELVSSGKVVHSVASRKVDGHFEADMVFPLLVDSPGWVALRVNSNGKSEMGEPLFAHTSPVYIEYSGKMPFRKVAAERLVADMKRAMRTIKEKATFATSAQHDDVMNVYRKGIDELDKQIKQFSQP